MRRRALHYLRLLSLVLCLTFITLWIRSQFIRPERVHFLLYDDALRSERELEVWGFRGGVLLSFGETRYLNAAAAVGAGATERPNLNSEPVRFAWVPSVNWYRDAPFPTAMHITWFGFEYWPHDEPDEDGRVVFSGRQWIFQVPYWPLVLATAVAPAAWLVGARRRRRRARRGLCRRCGYDLRESPARCPECGVPAPPP